MRYVVVVLAAFHALLIDGGYAWSVGSVGRKALVTILLGFLLWSFLLAWLLPARRRGPTVLASLLLVQLLCLYFTFNYRVYIDANSLAFLAETNFAEAGEFVGPATLGWIAGILFVAVAMFCLAARLAPRFVAPPLPYAKVIAPALLIGMASLINVKKTNHSEQTLHYPLIVELPMAVIAYARQKAIITYELFNRSDFSDVAFSGGDEEVEAVLIIGESARGRSFSLNGYPRNTNPQLSALDLISYRPVTSCAADTRISVPCLLTRATLKDPLSAATQISFTKGFKARGFQTTWFSSHRVSGENDSLIAALAGETDNQIFASGSYKTRTDKAILAQVVAYLNDPSGTSRLAVIHSIGSHWSYSNRYEPAFGKFTPVCTEPMAKACSIESLVNAYDNSLLATDDFISTVIKSLSGRNAFVIYTSDHGESLGEDGNFMHGKPKRPEQRDVPLIFWASDMFRQKHPERYSAALGHKGLALTHDMIFHSMLDCAGISSTTADRSLSLCSPAQGAQ